MRKLFIMRHTFIALSVLLATMLSVSCSKGNGTEEEEQEVSLIGKWISYCYDEFGEVGEFLEREPTSRFSVEFNETEATIVIGDMPNGVPSITTAYEFNDVDSTLTFPNVYEECQMSLFGQFKNAEVVIQQNAPYWDYSFVYHFVKE